MRIERILICIDDSPRAAVAVRQGRQLAKAFGVPVLIATLDSADGPVTARAHTEAEGLREAGIAADVRSCPRQTAAVAAKLAQPHDMLVFGLSTRAAGGLLGRRRQPHLAAASVRRPALVAGGALCDIERILVSASTSPTSLLAAQLGGQVAAALQASADIVHIGEAMPKMYAGLTRMEETTREVLGARTTESHVLNHCAHILERHGVGGEVRVVSGEVVAEILRAAADGDYDLIVVGPPPPQPLVFNLAFGDVTAGLIRAGERSVLVAARRQSANLDEPVRD